ncbi:Glycerophosphodiester phosphodiesterase 1 [Trichinella nativa]|uniref:Glycerophosphodiester phosphodiesterase 1 n=2 Tax=Trichinella TaxID=6333 RepID=A0A0V1LJ63_9BILA|nr:Glycerophosphodiester phosphodiesterase 1 [Trichinella murrelli]KRZ59552.1 Glycerophosphodiester phosphodiesterase 1 [Trichinella nativa]
MQLQQMHLVKNGALYNNAILPYYNLTLVTKSTAPMEQWIAQTLLMIVVLMAPAGALLLGCSRSRWMCFILLGVVSTVCFLCICVWISLFCDQQHPGDQPNLRQFLHNFTFGAHRGLADEAPENTLAAFEYSAKLGSTFVEFDLEMTADNTPVIMHDDTVDRTTNGTGFIGELDDDYVFSLNAAAKFKNGNFSVQKVPTLEEAVLLIKKLNMKMIIDVKRSDSEVIDAITSLFEKYPDLYDTVAVSSFHPQVAFKIVKADPKIITGHTWCKGYLYQQDCGDPTPRYNFALFHYGAIIVENIYHWLLHDVIVNFTGARLILTERRQVSQDYIDYAKKRGLHVVVWTVNKLSEQEYFYKVLRCAFMSDHLTDFVNNNNI